MTPESEEDLTGLHFFNAYEAEARSFKDDVYMLILGTLKAAVERISTDAQAELASIERKLKKVKDGPYHQHLVDQSVDVHAQSGLQERFLRNMALVALASRLIIALRKIAKAANHYVPQKKKYGIPSDSEFVRLWKEYNERFSIDFMAHADRVAFTEVLKEVRNHIVHEGSEANSIKANSFAALDAGEDAWLDKSFSTAHPEFVAGTGMFAEVEVKDEQLQEMVESSLVLVDWLAGEPYAQEQTIAAQIHPKKE